jgi:hypothetical protein
MHDAIRCAAKEISPRRQWPNKQKAYLPAITAS